MKTTRRVQAAAAGFALLIALSACSTTDTDSEGAGANGRYVEYRRYLRGRAA